MKKIIEKVIRLFSKEKKQAKVVPFTFRKPVPREYEMDNVFQELSNKYKTHIKVGPLQAIPPSIPPIELYLTSEFDKLYKPVPGDQVMIGRALVYGVVLNKYTPITEDLFENWGEPMDKYLGTIQTIREVLNDGHVIFVDNNPDYGGINEWSWHPEAGHLVHLKPAKDPHKNKKFKIKIG